MNGFVLIDKEENWTSRDVCNKIGRLFNEKKVGHAGTLDPFATGLMVVGLGSATKGLTFIRDNVKSYTAKLVLGKKTDSGDKTGNVILEKEIPNLNKGKIEEALSSFLGKSKQIPPMRSAIHFEGKKLYELARQGIEVDRTAREVEIFDIKLLDFGSDYIIFSCLVSKGTYIRTLGEDIASKLNTVGYLESLRRTSIDDLSIDKAKKITDIQEKDVLDYSDVISLYKVMVDDYQLIKIKNGLSQRFNDIDSHIEQILIVDKNNKAVAVYKRDDEINFSCVRGLW